MSARISKHVTAINSGTPNRCRLPKANYAVATLVTERGLFWELYCVSGATVWAFAAFKCGRDSWALVAAVSNDEPGSKSGENAPLYNDGGDDDNLL